MIDINKLHVGDKLKSLSSNKIYTVRTLNKTENIIEVDVPLKGVRHVSLREYDFEDFTRLPDLDKSHSTIIDSAELLSKVKLDPSTASMYYDISDPRGNMLYTGSFELWEDYDFDVRIPVWTIFDLIRIIQNKFQQFTITSQINEQGEPIFYINCANETVFSNRGMYDMLHKFIVDYYNRKIV